MADTAVASDTPAPATPAKKQKASTAAKKPKAKPTHPKTSEMVNNAIKELKERSGSSLQAIKKYIAAQYKVDAEKLAPFIRKYLKSAVESGALIQTKGKGASGSFKLENSGKKPAAKAGRPSAAAAKKQTPKKAASAGATKRKTAPASPSKAKSTTAAIKEKKAAKKKPAKKTATPVKASSKAKSATPKAKKTAKPPTRKPKAPKPKKVTAPKAKPAAKKVSKK